MKAAIFSLLIAAFSSSAAVWAQPRQPSTTFLLKRLTIEFDEQSQELSFVWFELWTPDRQLLIDCSNSRRFEQFPLPVYPLKVLYSFIVTVVILCVCRFCHCYYNRITKNYTIAQEFSLCFTLLRCAVQWVKGWGLEDLCLIVAVYKKANRLTKNSSSVALATALGPR